MRKIITAIIFVEITLLTFFIIPAKERLNVILGLESIKPYFYIIGLPIILHFLYYFIMSNKVLKHYKSNVLHIYSYKENVDLLWLRRLVLFFYGLLVLAGPIMIYLYYNNLSLAFGDYYYFAGLSIFVFFIGYWGYKQGQVFSFQTDDVTDQKPEEPVIVKSVGIQIPKEKIDVLKRVMETNKPYLNPALTIYELAQIIDIQPYQLSKLISQEFKCNFYEFINHYRIDVFKKHVNNPKYKDFTLLGIALECGFNSKSAFNRIFKEQTGQTPTEFKNSMSATDVLKN